ncbi:MAG TPA: acyl-CoA desaturase [Actinokineospora sp.]|nr:acyl-CoA desaturase [Actinokineospora sp.]
MTATVEGSGPQVDPEGPKAMFGEPRGLWPQIGTYIFILVPFAALIAAVPFAWGWGLGWVDVALAAFFYTVTCLGVTVGFHRYFTHGAFKANRPVRIGLAIVGSMAMQGPILHWVADHRRHHAFSDRDGDPHSPWAFGTSPAALVKGFWHAHMGWIFDRKLTNAERFAPDMLADPDIRRIDKQFGLWTAISMLAPALLGGLITWSLWGAVTAFFWATLVRISFLHHITWSTNSVCHIIGERPFKSRDKAANFWPLAILSMGEAWHNLHHADPTSARHGVRRGQIDISARLIWIFEKFGWVSEVRWPTEARLAKLAK